MAWIKVEESLLRHPKMFRFSAALNLSPERAMGHIVALWLTALQQQEDGDFSLWPDIIIAQSAYWQGDAGAFVSALQTSGFFDGKIIHDWLEYAGEYLRKKYSGHYKNKLVAIWAKHGLVYGDKDSGDSPKRLPEQSPNESPKCSPKQSPNTHQNYRLDLDKDQDKEVEVSTTTTKQHSSSADAADALPSVSDQPQPKHAYTQDFETFWQAYPRKVGKSAAYARWRAKKPDINAVLSALDVQKQCDQWKDISLIPHPATWLGQERWEDDPSAYGKRSQPTNDDYAYAEAEAMAQAKEHDYEP